MSALYLHIPFCKQACHYCDFHFSTNTSQKSAMVKAICKEIELQADYLQQKHLQSIYFGGGTPSLLNEEELCLIFEQISRFYTFDARTEITLEANPDDLSKENLLNFKKIGINRLSIGVQSFQQEHLNYLHRVHTAQEATQSIRLAQEVAGFSNINIDLIYAIASSNHYSWQNDLEQAMQLQIPHISAYCLTIEPKTVFGHRLQKSQMPAIDEDFAAQQLHILMQTLQKEGYEQYEISNFAKNQAYAIHNTHYWKDKEYLGIGPSAHSYNHTTRHYNIAHNAKYIDSIEKNHVPLTSEILSWQDRLNEYLLTGLRTQWGCEYEKVKQLARIDFFAVQKDILDHYQEKKYIQFHEQAITLTQEGRFFADQIASDLFIIAS